MRMLVQKVHQAKLTVDGKLISEIKEGYLVYLGIKVGDTIDLATKMADKLTKLRLYYDEHDKMNLSLNKETHEIMVVSQFTLYGDVRRNNRPSFTLAAKAEEAFPIYEYFIHYLQMLGYLVKQGQFGAHMKIEAINDGPLNIWVTMGDEDEV
ncbi:MAG TPA: D-aminoacyl-tRNA deacylase [Acholeplasma sp.]